MDERRHIAQLKQVIHKEKLKNKSKIGIAVSEPSPPESVVAQGTPKC